MRCADILRAGNAKCGSQQTFYEHHNNLHFIAWLAENESQIIYMAPNDIKVLIPRNCEHVALQGQKDIAYVIKLRILRWGRLSWIIPVGPMLLPRFL